MSGLHSCREGENMAGDYKTNEQYRRELNQIFESIEDNYVLKWFYIFIKEKLKKRISLITNPFLITYGFYLSRYHI